MNKLLLMTMTLCISCLVIAQEKGVKIQSVERLPMGDGTMIYRHTEGQKAHLNGECRLVVSEREYLVAVFKDGFPNGKWETYRDNKLYEKRQYKEGRLDGKVLTYASDGKTVVEEGTALGGKRNGRYATYYSNGQLQKEQEYKDGKEHGYLRTYEQDGRLKWDCNYENGKMHGEQMQFYISNRDDYVRVANYEHGTLVGDYKETYFKGGGIKTQGTYDKNGKKTGRWIEKEYNGDYRLDCEYKNGEYDGVRRKYFADGDVSEISHYKAGKLHGVATKYYHPTKKVHYETTYENDRKMGPFKEYNKDGWLESEGVNGAGTISQRYYYPNGQLRQVEEYADGKGTQIVEKYDEKGNKLSIK